MNFIKSRKGKITVTLIAVVIGLAILLVLALPILRKESDYRSANSLMDTGNYGEAKELFVLLNGYRESENLLTECLYQLAVIDFDGQKYDEAETAFLALNDYKESATYVLECKYQPALALYENKNYADAQVQLEALGEYKDSKTLASECAYHIALAFFENGEYENAIVAFEKLGDFKDSQEYIVKAKNIRKYALYDQETNSYEYLAITLVDKAEARMESLFYGTWYHYTSGEELIVDQYQIGGKDYGVIAVSEYTPDVHAYYLSNPDEAVLLRFEFDYFFEHINEGCSILVVTDASGTFDYYRSVDLATYEDMVAREEHERSKVPAYPNDVVISKTFSHFKNKIGGNYSGPATLYHSSNYSDEMVEYDYETKTYTCTMTCKYITNIFDMFGTSTYTYYVNAQYKDTGSELALINISIY